jgi:adenylate cyclase
VLVHQLGDYFEVLSRQLRRHSGTIDKFIGDGLLGFFNAPENVPDHQNLACRATLLALDELSSRPDGPPFRTRVGLHCGEVLVGNIGTPDRFAYTVLGDVVNVTSRLESLNKVYGTQILASSDVRDGAGDDFEWRHLDRVAVAGRKGGMDIHELMGLKGQSAKTRCLDRDLYEEALAHYLARRFPEAKVLFSQLARTQPADKAATVMTTRCDHFFSIELPDDWNGVFAYEFK